MNTSVLATRQIADIERQRDAYRKALEEIVKGEGPFSRDQITHASNTIEAMKAIARKALEGGKP